MLYSPQFGGLTPAPTRHSTQHTRMSLRTLELPLLLNTSDHDLFQGFFVPALSHAFRYDRGVGYFASGWLRLAAQGL